MKKYLWVLLPVAAGALFAYVYGSVAEADYPIPAYPFRTSDVLEFLQSTWFMAGAVLSAVLFFFFLMSDSVLFVGSIVAVRRARKTAVKLRFTKKRGRAKPKAGSPSRR